MVAHLEAEDCVAIFPEGTRSKDGRLGEIKGGALMAARLGRAPIVPVGLEGAHRAWGRGLALPLPRLNLSMMDSDSYSAVNFFGKIRSLRSGSPLMLSMIVDDWAVSVVSMTA